jgi:hypothetical protein
MSQQNDITLDRVQQALGAATADQDAATELLADPAAYFRQHGLDRDGDLSLDRFLLTRA